MAKITIIGTGAYGTALANVLTDNNHVVMMYGIEQDEIDDINQLHVNSKFFGDLKLRKEIQATHDLKKALHAADYLIMGVPTGAIEGVITKINDVLDHKVILINVAKGLDPKTNELLSCAYKRWLKAELNGGIAALYGPSIASEVVERKPTCIMGAADSMLLAQKVCALFNNHYFVMKPSSDIVGCEVAAALKNIIAVGSGMFMGLNSSDNASSSLIAMGLNEIAMFGMEKGAKLATFLNFASLGDLILTATSKKSRNYSLGQAIGEADDADSVLSRHTKTVEGVLTCKTIYNEAKLIGLNLPLINGLYKILYNHQKPSVVFANLFIECKLVTEEIQGI